MLEAEQPRTRWRRVAAWCALAAVLLAIPAAWTVQEALEESTAARIETLRDRGVIAAERIERARVSIAAYAGPLLESPDPEVRAELQRIMQDASPEGRAALVDSIASLNEMFVIPWQSDVQLQRDSALAELRVLAEALRLEA